MLSTHLCLVPSLGMSGDVPLFSIYTFMACAGSTLPFLRNDIFGPVSMFFTSTRLILFHWRVEGCKRQSSWPNFSYRPGVHLDSLQNSWHLGRDSNGVPPYYLLKLTYIPFSYVSSHTAEIHSIFVSVSEKRAFCLYVRRVSFIPPLCIPHRHMKFAHHTFTAYRERRQDVTVLGL
jgi:hypothetical protein